LSYVTAPVQCNGFQLVKVTWKIDDFAAGVYVSDEAVRVLVYSLLINSLVSFVEQCYFLAERDKVAVLKVSQLLSTLNNI
jgi:hypothetical protein